MGWSDVLSRLCEAVEGGKMFRLSSD